MTTAAKLVPVVGVTFARGYPVNILRLNQLISEAAIRPNPEPLTAVLVRNPGNEHDANAVEVHVPALGDLAMIGHVSRDNAARLAPLMDSGIAFECWVVQTRIDPQHLDRPGIDIGVARAPVPGGTAVPAGASGGSSPRPSDARSLPNPTT